MTNLIIILFTFVILVNHRILLLNEESLILLCFITFITLILQNLGGSINDLFKRQYIDIESNLKKTFKNILKNFRNYIILQKNTNLILQRFSNFRKYFLKFIIFTNNRASHNNNLHLTHSYKNKLNFLVKVESQTIKFLILILIKNLNEIVKMRHFYSSSIKIKKFTTLNKIYLRECIQSIDSKL